MGNGRASITAEGKARRYESLFEESGVGIAELNMEGNLTNLNDRFCEMLGYSQEEMSEKTLGDVTHPDDMKLDEENIPLLLEGKISSYEGEKRYIHKSGREFWVHIVVTLLIGADGSPEGFFGIITDIDARKREEQARQEAERRYRAVFENLGLGIAEANMQGTLTSVNDAFCEMMGYTRDELLAKTFSDITHPEDRNLDGDNIPLLLEGKIQSYSGEKRYLRKDGELIWVELTATILRDADGNPEQFLGVITDVTQKKADAHELEIAG